MAVIHPALDLEAVALLDRLGAQEGPIPYDELVASRARVPDRELAGVSEPIEAKAEMLLPLPATPIRVRIYRSRTNEPRPLLLWLHGGGFVGGSLDDIDVTCTAVALRAGVNVVSLDYRLAPEHPFPAALTDTTAALAWLRDHGAVVGGDGRIAAGGQSAGANLVTAAALAAREGNAPQVDRQILCYPSLDFSHDSDSHRAFAGILLTESRSRWCHDQYLAGQPTTPLTCPLLADSFEGLPPALVLTAGHDPLRDDGHRFATRLEQDGVSVRQLEYPGTIHAFLNFPGALSVAWEAIGEIAEDLRTFFGLGPESSALQHVTNTYDRGRVDELRAFYSTVVGLTEKTAPPPFGERGIVWFRAGSGERELHFVPDRAGDGSQRHFCLAVDDIVAAAAQLETAGLTLEWSDAIPSRPRFFCRDPFDNLVEFTALGSA